MKSVKILRVQTVNYPEDDCSFFWPKTILDNPIICFGPVQNVLEMGQKAKLISGPVQTDGQNNLDRNHFGPIKGPGKSLFFKDLFMFFGTIFWDVILE